jgi:hypothetical protein
VLRYLWGGGAAEEAEAAETETSPGAFPALTY